MENQELYLFIRVRGKVVGPFGFDKLVALARKGQLSRMHDVSIDQMSWERAGQSYPQIWEEWTVMAPTPQPVEAQDVNFEGNAGETAIEIDTSQSTEGAAMWHYTKGGSEQSPITLDELKHLFSLGELTSDEDVWTEGMSQWRNAGDVPALADVVGGKRPIPSGSSGLGAQVPQQQGYAQPQIIIQNPAPAPHANQPHSAGGEKVSGGLIVAGYICAFLFALVGFIIGVSILSKGEGGHGAAILILSLINGFIGIVILGGL
jgi:hypothetical protein